MTAALRLVTANDNLPAVPVPAIPEAAPATPFVATGDRARDGLATLVIAWSLAIAAFIGLFPGSFSLFMALPALIGAAAIPLALRYNQPAWLWVTGVGIIASAFAATQSATALSALVWPPVLLSLAIIGSATAHYLKSDRAATAIGAGTVTAIAIAAMSVTSEFAAAAVIVGVTGLVYLGLARAGAKGSVRTMRAHYLVAWLACCIAGLIAIAPGGAPQLVGDTAILAGGLGLAALYVWGRQGIYALSQVLAVLFVVSLLAVPALQDSLLPSLTTVYENQPLAHLLGSACLLAASAALTVRGARQRHLPMSVLGAGFGLVSLLLVLNPSFMNLENAVVLGLSASVATAWLLAARLA